MFIMYLHIYNMQISEHNNKHNDNYTQITFILLK